MRERIGGKRALGAALGVLLGFAAPIRAGETLDSVKSEGRLRCGLVEELASLARRDERGRWQGFDADICRALAAALLGNGEAVDVVPLDPDRALAALGAREVDVLARAPDRGLVGRPAGVRFTTYTLVDGQGFLVPAKRGPVNVLALHGAKVCVEADGPGIDRLSHYTRTIGIDTVPVPLDTLDLMSKAFFAGRCDAVSAGRLALAVVRARDAPNPAAYAILPEVISREQMGPYVRDQDRDWLNLVRWTVLALIQAEESGITRDTVEIVKATSEDPRVQRLLGVSGGLGAMLGLDDDWAYRAIREVGNYAELYDRHLGPGTPLDLERGPNALWRDGGLLYALPFQ